MQHTFPVTEREIELAAADVANATRFDWDAWNARLDAGLAKLDRIERDAHAAHVAMIRDVRAMIEEAE